MENEGDKNNDDNDSNKDDRHEMDIDNDHCFDEVDSGPATEDILDSSVVSEKDDSDTLTANKDFLKTFNISQCFVQLKDISVNSLDKSESIFSKKTIEEVDSGVSEMVERSDVPEGMVKHRKSSFKCALCGQICKNENEAKQHGANFGCSAYNSAWQPKDKWTSHSKTRPFQCSMCKLCYTDKNSLRKHSLEVHGGGDRKFQCDICLKVFKRVDHVKTHMEHVHLELRPFVCDICGRSYKGRGSLTHHMRSHTGEHETCETCGRDFRDPSDLKKHIRNVHLKIKNFKCDICGHACSKQSDLSSRMNSHIDKSLKARNFQCQECDWRAVTASQLRVHMKMHIKTLAYKCLHCAKQFKCEYYLERHKRHLHDRTGETFQCLQCPKSFTRKEYLNKHMKLHKFGRAFKCQTCGVAFVHFGSLKEHIKCRHEGKKRKGKTCAVCGKSVTHFKTHMMSHIKEKPFECARCWKRFLTEKRLKLHYRVHLDVKPYFCKGCDVGFARREYYCLHMIKFHDTKLSPNEADLRGKTENLKFSDSDDDDVGDADVDDSDN